MLQIRGLKKSLGKKAILKGVDLTIQQGEIVGLLGKNGAGKTTLIKCIDQLYQYDGEIAVGCIDPHAQPEKFLGSVGVLLEPSFYDYMTGLDNLQACGKLCGKTVNVNEQQLKELLAALGLTEAINKKVKDYSFGMKQKLGVVMALIKKPAVLVLDEPTIGVDPSGLQGLFAILKRLAEEEGIAIIFSSNNLAEVQAISDKIAFLKDGQITDLIKTHQLIDKENSYTVQIREAISAEVSLEMGELRECTAMGQQIEVNDVDTLNQVIRILVDKGHSILDIKRENRLLQDFYGEVSR